MAGLLFAHPERGGRYRRADPAIIAKQEALLARLRRPDRDES
jgi:hypothetical protein